MRCVDVYDRERLWSAGNMIPNRMRNSDYYDRTVNLPFTLSRCIRTLWQLYGNQITYIKYLLRLLTASPQIFAW